MPDAVADSAPKKMVVASMLYRSDQAPQELSIDHIDEYTHGGGKRLLWVGLKDPDPALLEQIGAKLGFSRRIMEEIIEPHRRVKVIEFKELTLIIAITVEVEGTRPAFGEIQMLVGKDFLITIRRGATATHKGLREHLEGMPELLERGSDFVASTLLDLLVDRYVVALTRYEAEVEAVEQKFLLRGFGDFDVRKLYRLRRDLLRIHTSIFPLTEVCRRLARVEMVHIDIGCRGYFGEVADRVQRVDELINSLREALAFAFEAGSMIGQSQQTDITKKLASWAAILAVPTAVAGIYGMNFQDMPELKWAYGYPLIIGITAAACGLLYWKFKKAKWL
jgi:magnesium transporter